jgi:Protein of unknown function (DUF3800)
VLVFIDESGDPGFKVSKGASPVFVAAMVVFDSGDAASKTKEAIEESEARKRHRREFKFSKCSDRVRDAYFEAVCSSPFGVRAIVVRKEVIYSPRLQANKERFYEYFVKQMMKYDGGMLKDARVVIDGSGDRAFRQSLNAALRHYLGAGVIRQIRFKDSRADVLVQLADMCAGAVARSYRTDRRDARRWRRILRSRISDIWEFK